MSIYRLSPFCGNCGEEIPCGCLPVEEVCESCGYPDCEGCYHGEDDPLKGQVDTWADVAQMEIEDRERDLINRYNPRRDW